VIKERVRKKRKKAGDGGGQKATLSPYKRPNSTSKPPRFFLDDSHSS
jgi:hypothetical protein